MKKWWKFCNGYPVKCQNIMVFFSYLRVLIYLQFLAVLTGLGGGSPPQFIFHIHPYRPLHLHIRLLLPLPHNISPHCSLFSLPLPLPHHLCSPHAPLSISIPLPLPHYIFPPHAPLSLSLALPNHLHPPLEPLYLSLPIHLPHPPCLSQSLPHCHSYTNMRKRIQWI